MTNADTHGPRLQNPMRTKKNVPIKIIPNNKQFSFRFYFCQLCVGCYIAISSLRLSSPNRLSDKSMRYWKYPSLISFLLCRLSNELQKKSGLSIGKRGHVYMLNEHSFGYEIAYRCLIPMIEEKVRQTFLHIFRFFILEKIWSKILQMLFSLSFTRSLVSYLVYVWISIQ